MKKKLLEFLVCPSCLPEEEKLSAGIFQEKDDDILSGVLRCGRCCRKYPVRDGMAVLLPEKGGLRGKARVYRKPSVLASYLWSHYGDLLQDSDHTPAYSEWSALMQDSNGACLDAGCAVGRFTFEMASKYDLAVGVDSSAPFVQTARELLTRKRVAVRIPVEGNIVESRIIRLPEEWKTANVEFILGDVQSLPFRSGAFSSAASLNMIDKVPRPLDHLLEIDRITVRTGAQLLVSDPFSWSEEVAPKDLWLGGSLSGPFSGSGIDNLRDVLTGEIRILDPPWNVEKQGHVWWKIRTHRNHYELIRSRYIKAVR